MEEGLIQDAKGLIISPSVTLIQASSVNLERTKSKTRIARSPIEEAGRRLVDDALIPDSFFIFVRVPPLPLRMCLVNSVDEWIHRGVNERRRRGACLGWRNAPGS